MVDDYVTKNPHPANDIQGQALSNVVTIQVVREVIKKFIKNIDPDEFFKNGGNEESLATLLAKECQGRSSKVSLPQKIKINEQIQRN